MPAADLVPKGKARTLCAHRQPRRAVVRQPRGVNEGRQLLPEDWGARDPFPGEIASNFSEKVIGNWDTEHLIRPPDAIAKIVGLGARHCTAGAPLLDAPDAERLRNQVPGWRVVQQDGLNCIRQDWKCQDQQSAEALKERVESIGVAEGHAVAAASVVGSEAFVVLTSKAAGGLTENDFIVAAKINALDLSDLLAKRRARYWA